MTDTATLETTTRNLDGFIAEIGDVPHTREPSQIRKKSHDFFWYSPVLKPLLENCAGDIVVTPRSEDDVVKVARAAARYRIPITPRGGGTGNYGQAVPLSGGIVLDMIRMDEIKSITPGVVRVGPGKMMLTLEKETRPHGWELRMYPSTKRTATIGGFVAGGSGGIGSVTYGGLREPGNVLSARVVTVEDEPRILDLRGAASNVVNHAYSTTGIITELEMPLSPVWPWRDVVATFDDFEDAGRCAFALGRADGIVKKLVTVCAWPIHKYFPRLKDILPANRHLVIAMIAEPSMDAFRDVVAENKGRIDYDEDAIKVELEAKYPPLYEYTWNHTTLHALKVDKSITYLQTLFPAENTLEHVQHMRTHFGDELPMHLEIIKYGGALTCSGLQLIRFTSAERLDEIIAYHESHGAMIANPHVYTLEDGVRHKKVAGDQLGFKIEADPYGLMNPGKMRSFSPAMGR